MASARPRPKVMTLTEAAAARAREIMTSNGRDGALLRVGVKNGGCAGMSYTMDWTSQSDPRDEVFEDKGVRLVIDPKAVLFLLGTEMDFETTKLSSGFVFRNPNQTSACGCGESVAIQPAHPEQLAEIQAPGA
jgi:iron-sulfur cluster assembly protein